MEISVVAIRTIHVMYNINIDAFNLIDQKRMECKLERGRI